VTSGCVAGGVSGPKVIVHYTGLIEAPRNVHCEEITGHSAVVTWNTGWPDTYCFHLKAIAPSLI